MIREIPASFSNRESARAALTETRKRCRIALRGAVVIGPDCFGSFRIHASLGGTGYSAPELAAELRASDV